jgi:gliding motility-associated lipoprotein GldB
MMIRLKYLILFLMPLALFFACKEDKIRVDVSQIQVDVNLQRIEKELFNEELTHSKHFDLYNRFGEFYKRYVENIILAGPAEDSLTLNAIRMFTSDKEIKEVYQEVNKQFADITPLKNDLTEAFKHYRYFFPDKLIPQVVTFVSGFNYAVAATDSVLGIGLDMYLGNDYKFYQMIGFPQYKADQMTKDYIASDAVKSWIATEFDFDPIDKDLLDQMIHHGKLMYILDIMLPDVPDTIKLGYSKDQLDWCKANEVNVWAHLVDNQMLFTTHTKEIMKYMNEGPFTPGLPRESPSRIGYWVGWQIVKAYMNKQNNLDLYSLMDTEAQKILKESKYKPKW